MWLEKHKALVITVVVALTIVFLTISIEGHRERMASKTQAVTDNVLAKKDGEIGVRNQDFLDFKNQMMDEIKGIKTAKQGMTVLQPIIQSPTVAPEGIKKSDLSPDAQKQVAGDPNEHLNLFTDDQVKNLAVAADQCKIDKAGLSTCEADQKSMQEKIDALTKANREWKDAGTVPRWTLFVGASKTADGTYKPAGMLSYRVQHHLGLSVGAVNNALVGGINIHFGSEPKVKEK